MEPFFWVAAGKKLPGKHGQQDLIAAPTISFLSIKLLKNIRFIEWHGFRSDLGEPRLGRALRFSDPQAAWEGKGYGSFRGRTSDGECASHRTFAANGAGTAARYRCQQHRQRQHGGLQ